MTIGGTQGKQAAETGPDSSHRATYVISPEQDEVSAVIESVRWTPKREPVSLSAYYMTRAVYPRIAAIASDLGCIPLHESQDFRFLTLRPSGDVTVHADFEVKAGKSMLVHVRLDDLDRETWAEGTLSFLLLKETRRQHDAI